MRLAARAQALQPRRFSASSRRYPNCQAAKCKTGAALLSHGRGKPGVAAPVKTVIDRSCRRLKLRSAHPPPARALRSAGSSRASGSSPRTSSTKRSASSRRMKISSASPSGNTRKRDTHGTPDPRRLASGEGPRGLERSPLPSRRLRVLPASSRHRHRRRIRRRGQRWPPEQPALLQSTGFCARVAFDTPFHSPIEVWTRLNDRERLSIPVGQA